MEPIHTHISRQYNAALEETVIMDDTKVNRLEVTIDEECQHIIARRQPAASDLRLVVAVIKTITDLERIGDEAEKIARMAVRLANEERPKNNYAEIQALGNHVRTMVHDALDAFERVDAQGALQTAREDRQIDQKYESIMRQ